MPHRRDKGRRGTVCGETDSEVVLPDTAGIIMPAGSHTRYRSILSIPAVPVSSLIDVDAVAALLDSHAQVSNVRLRILFADGQTYFEAAPAKPAGGKESRVPLRLPDHQGVVLCGALQAQKLELIAHVIERAVVLGTASGAQAQALDQEQKRLSLVFEFSEKVCQLAAFEEVVTRFLADVTRILNASEGTFFALDPRRKDLFIRCSHGTRPEVVRDFRLKVGEGIAGAVAADGRPRIVNDVSKCPDYVDKGNPIRNIIAAPILVREQLIGVINISDRARGAKPFSNRDLQLLVSLARLGGVALDNAQLYEEVRHLLLATVEALTAAIEARDRFTHGRSRRVAFLCETVARRQGMGHQEVDLLRIAALLRDIGNLAIPDAVLSKPGPLTAEERRQVKEHPHLGASILSPVKQLSAVLPGVVDHHERYDGRGYPRRLKGDEISLQGRIIAIADTFDAMTHDRPFRRACSPADALAEITAQAGSQFDPALVPIFVECYRSLELERVLVDELVPPAGPELDF